MHACIFIQPVNTAVSDGIWPLYAPETWTPKAVEGDEKRLYSHDRRDLLALISSCYYYICARQCVSKETGHGWNTPKLNCRDDFTNSPNQIIGIVRGMVKRIWMLTSTAWTNTIELERFCATRLGAFILIGFSLSGKNKKKTEIYYDGFRSKFE